MSKTFFSFLIVIFLAGCSNLLTQPELEELNLKTVTYFSNKIVQADTFLAGNGETHFNGIDLGKLKERSDSILKDPPPTVTDKKENLKNVDPKDYVSQAPYWWPNPNSKDKLPYIHKDGERNPEATNKDRAELSRLKTSIIYLSLTYHLTGEEKYAKKAISFLTSWFKDPKTKMNPHMQYAQGIPGLTDGRPVGIIESRDFISILDGISLLENSRYWNKELEHSIYNWFESFLKWLFLYDLGKKERNKLNNHGSWYDFQIVSFSQAVNKIDFLRSILKKVSSKRIDEQINDDGQQPHEINRSLGLHYSIFNLIPLTSLADIAKEYDINIWDYPSDKNSKLLKAIDYLIPYIFEEEEWPYHQIKSYNKCDFLPILNAAYNHTKERKYLKRYKQLKNISCQELYFY